MSRVPQENTREFTDALTKGEKILLQNFVRLESGEKWGRNVLISIPKSTMENYNMIYGIWKSCAGSWFPLKIEYFF
jgi:hypothetical protein